MERVGLVPAGLYPVLERRLNVLFKNVEEFAGAGDFVADDRALRKDGGWFLRGGGIFGTTKYTKKSLRVKDRDKFFGRSFH